MKQARIAPGIERRTSDLGARTARHHTGLPAHISPERIEALLANRIRNLTLPPDVCAHYRIRTWDSRRKLLVSWCIWIAALNFLCGVFDILIVPEPMVPWFILGRTAVSAAFLLAVVALQRPLSAAQEGLAIILPCMALMTAAGLCGFFASDQLLERHIVNATFVVGTGVMIARIEPHYTVWLVVLTAPLLVLFILLLEATTIYEKGQLIVFHAGALLALMEARRIQNRVQYRLFLLDIDQELKSEQLFKIARTDPLTQLPNRRHFDAMFEALAPGGEPASPFALCMIDIDHFKKLNDTLGHIKGDECLRAVAAALRDGLRAKSDLVARFGGEEFAVLLPGADAASAFEIAERLRLAVAALDLCNPDAPTGRVTVSIGVAIVPEVTVDEAIDCADHALYKAKMMGRDQVRVYGAATKALASAVRHFAR
jgi:diguanylate cyclase (GGDEF)-like protein